MPTFIGFGKIISSAFADTPAPKCNSI